MDIMRNIMPPLVVFKLFRPPLISSPLMPSGFSVSVPHTDAMVTFDSVSPETNAFPTPVTEQPRIDLVRMDDELQGHDSQLSDSAEIEDRSSTSVTPLRLGRPKKKARWQKYDGPPTTREEVLRVSLTVHPQVERHRICPAGFDKLGRLRHQWGYMRKEIQQAKAAPSTSEAAQDSNPLHSDTVGDRPEEESIVCGQQVGKNSISYAKNPRNEHRNNPERAVQTAGTQPSRIEASRHNSVQIRDANGGQSQVHHSLDPRSQQQSRPGMLDVPNSSQDLVSQHTEPDEMDVATTSGANFHLAIIRCSDQDCAKQQFNAPYLARHCGIDIKDAKEKQQKDQFWLCPECAHKADVLKGHDEPVTHGTISRQPKFGTRRLEDDMLRDFLRQFSGLLTDYSAKTASKPTGPNLQMPIWDIPCVREEVLNPVAGRVNQFVVQLRQLLDVPDGVSIKDKVDNCHLSGYRNSLWLRGILVSVFSDAVFHQGSPFESDDILYQSLEYVGLQSDMVQSISQDCRVRTFGEDPQPKEFCERLQSRHQWLVQKLNNIMMAIVGCDSIFDGFHRDIADLAKELNAHISTDTKGTFQEIRPVAGDPFDPRFHRLENREQDATTTSFAGHPILVTTMVGIKYRLPGRGWRVCSPAEVEIQRLAVSAGPHKVSRIVPCKRLGPSIEQVDLINE